MKSAHKIQSILIIGGGLGGLALAQGLTAAGLKVTVFERDKDSTSRTQGYRISIRSMGLSALKALLPPDLFDRLPEATVKDVGTGFCYATDRMRLLFKVPEGKGYVVQMLRSKLREILLTGLKVEWNKKLISIIKMNNQIEAQFEDGTTAHGDLLIGCDGSHSTVREILRNHFSRSPESIPKVVNSGIVLMGGHIERAPEWDQLLPLNRFGPVRFLGSNGHSFFVSFSEYEDRNPSIMWIFSQHLEKFDASKQALLDHCFKMMENENWHPSLIKLVKNTHAHEMLEPWIIRTTRFEKISQLPMDLSGQITLLGDAVHAMPPDRGIGGSNVFEDARVLASLLAVEPGESNLPKLIGEYERLMLVRAKKEVELSNKAAKIHHLQGFWSIRLRNLILKLDGIVITLMTKLFWRH